MATRAAFASDEWYHCYSRGIDKRITFTYHADYERFIQCLYICNNTKSIHRSDMRNWSTEEILRIPRPATLVHIGAFSLMPNHFHLLLMESKDGGISAFMQRLGTAYSMYFNTRYERTGSLFTKPFRSRHINTDEYLQHCIAYIHCNPAELIESQWKKGKVKNIHHLEKSLLEYQYGSFGAFTSRDHPFRRILDESIFNVETQQSPARMLEDALTYYHELPVES